MNALVISTLAYALYLLIGAMFWYAGYDKVTANVAKSDDEVGAIGMNRLRLFVIFSWPVFIAMEVYAFFAGWHRFGLKKMIKSYRKEK